MRVAVDEQRVGDRFADWPCQALEAGSRRDDDIGVRRL